MALALALALASARLRSAASAALALAASCCAFFAVVLAALAAVGPVDSRGVLPPE